MQTNKNGSLVLSKNEYLIAGSLSGFVSRAIVQPLDVLKIRFQLQVEPISASSSSKYHGFAQAIRCISKEEGASAFWKGLIPAQLQAVTFSAMQFLSFEVLVSLFVQFNQHGGARRDPRSSLKSSNTFGTFACGCIAGSISAGFTQPLDVLRTRFIAQGEPKLYR
ncbi:Mitochondrial thiamine pyrophosphate carrier [Fasciola hepatica]|uniref:Mitochondrial thiamine pyrophosphate carrier n=1 Tax=Fasciola hepatica TaxID=6192 RepID=A0A4E0QXH1_FASHE|nr:Mitochondrial thiamine pyrophosphate carrier [Fasciola hepatica]